MKIRRFKNKDIFEAAVLIGKTFTLFNTGKKLNKFEQSYIDFYNPNKNLDKIKTNFKKSKIFLIAEENGMIVGLIRGSFERIVNLYVDKKKHRKGIGNKLMHFFEKISKLNGSKHIKIRSSLYALPFYQKLGYKKSTGVRLLKGLKIQPLIKKFDKK